MVPGSMALDQADQGRLLLQVSLPISKTFNQNLQRRIQTLEPRPYSLPRQSIPPNPSALKGLWRGQAFRIPPLPVGIV